MIVLLQIIFSFFLIYSSYKIENSTFGPGTIGNSIWIISAIFGATGSRYDTFSAGLLIVQIYLIIYTIFCLLGEINKNEPLKITYLEQKNKLPIKWKLLISILFINAILTVILPIYHVGLKLTASDLIKKASEELSLNRYTGDGLPIHINAMLGILYAHCLVLGTVMGRQIKLSMYERIALYIAPVCIIFFGMITTARLTILIGLIFITSGYASSISIREIKINKQLTNITTKKLSILTIFIFILACFFVIAGGLRAGEFDIALLSSKLLTYTSGIQGLGEWLLQSDFNKISYGAYTFAGPFSLLGISQREIGLIQEYYFLPDGQQSNLYTSLRWIIEDFTIIGSATIIALYGLISGYIWKKIRLNNSAYTAIYSIILTITICSPIFSMFSYNNLLLAIFSYYLINKLNLVRAQ